MQVIAIDERTWRIEDSGVRFFLLAGESRALLIDSGMQVQNARKIALSLTDLPVELLNTHADRDHVAGNHQFEWFYMNPAEASNYFKTQGQAGTIRPVWDGDVIDLGGRRLEIIELPGHTPGSIAVLDEANRALINGDPIQDGDIYMFGVQREIHAYVLSLEKLKRYEGRFDAIYPSHGTFPVTPDIIPALREGALRVLAGQAPCADVEVHGIPVKRYDLGVAGLLCDF